MNVVDMHCDTITELYQNLKNGGTGNLRKNTFHMDLERMERGDYLIQNFAVFTHIKREEKPMEYALRVLDYFYREMEENQDLIGVVKSYRDIEENRARGRMSAILTIEEGAVCQGDLAFLRNFYRLGVRMMTLTWNFENELGHPNKMGIKDGHTVLSRCEPDTEHGLTQTGIAFVQEMERLGMIVDVAHLGDAGIRDVFSHTKKPFVASHSNARSVAGHPRNLTDEMIRALAERGGVAGINFCAGFLKDDDRGEEPTRSECADMVRHMKHMRQIGGIGCIGLGSDFDGITSKLELGDCSGIQLLAEEMNRQGFLPSEIDAVFSGNVLRLYKEILR